MGSRAAVMCCNDITCDQLRQFIKGVICLAYPLHPPHQLNNLRSQPLIDLTKPFILLSGTQDDMATQKLLEDVLQQNKGITRKGNTVGHFVSFYITSQLSNSKITSEIISL